MLALSTDTADLRRQNTFSIGVMIALSSWALIFFTLVWGYIVFRFRASSWLADSLTSEAKMIAVLNTATILLSSWCLSRVFKPRVPGKSIWAWSAFAVGIYFLIGQLYLWQVMMWAGLHWSTSLAGGVFFLLTGFHALHVVGGLTAILLFCLHFKKWQGTFAGLGIKYFWDFLSVVWIVMFVLIFIVQ